MNTPPAVTDLNPNDIAGIVASHWKMDVDRMTYLPLGFGSHHWFAEVRGSTAQSVFVTADRVAPGSAAEKRLRRALSAAWHLRHRGGVAAVVAPILAADGEVLVPVNADWVVALYPYVAVEKSEWGEFTNVEDRHRAQQLVAQVHSVDPSTLPEEGPPVEDFVIPYRVELFERFAELDEPWVAGPYADQTRLMLLENVERIETAFTRYDALVDNARETNDECVVTHGEPHAGNIIRRTDRLDMVMVDWDTCAIAPRERDLWQLLPSNDHTVAGIAAYLESAGIPDAAVSPDRLSLYRLRWDLAEIAIYADGFFNEHQDTEDSRVAWGGLQASIELLKRHLR